MFGLDPFYQTNMWNGVGATAPSENVWRKAMDNIGKECPKCCSKNLLVDDDESTVCGKCGYIFKS